MGNQTVADLSLHPRLEALKLSLNPSPLTSITDSNLEKHDIRLSIKQDELIHPVLSGNKWRKLKYVLNHVLESGYKGIISMGGAYSNHLHALAYAGRELNLPVAGLVRGEQTISLTPTLKDVRHWGMQLHFVSRTEYRQLRQPELDLHWRKLYPDYYWLPEGGAVDQALKGVAEILSELPGDYDWLGLACGTGTTLAGLASQLAPPRQILGIAAVKHADFLYRDIAQLLGNTQADNWQIQLDYHQGGFGCVNPTLLNRIHRFEQQQGIRLEPIYTGKLLMAVEDLMNNGFFQAGQHIILLHSGGLQGWRSDGSSQAII